MPVPSLKYFPLTYINKNNLSSPLYRTLWPMKLFGTQYLGLIAFLRIKKQGQREESELWNQPSLGSNPGSGRHRFSLKLKQCFISQGPIAPWNPGCILGELQLKLGFFS